MALLRSKIVHAFSYLIPVFGMLVVILSFCSVIALGQTNAFGQTFIGVVFLMFGLAIGKAL